MNILNDFFDKIFLITTSHETERHVHIKNFIKENKILIEIIFAPNKKYCTFFNYKDFWGGDRFDNNAYISLTSAYNSIFQNAIFHGYEKILILEDDIFFENDYEINFVDFIKKLQTIGNL